MGLAGGFEDRGQGEDVIAGEVEADLKRLQRRLLDCWYGSCCKLLEDLLELLVAPFLWEYDDLCRCCHHAYLKGTDFEALLVGDYALGEGIAGLGVTDHLIDSLIDDS